MSTSGGIPAGANALTATAHLTAAEIATLFSAPTALLPAPAADKAYANLGGFVQYLPTSGGWTNTDSGGFRVYYGATGPPQIAGYAATCQFDYVINGLNPADGDRYQQLVNVGDEFSPAPLLADAQAQPLIVANVSDPDPIGAISTKSIAAAGLGYAPGDTGTIAGKAYGTTATYNVTTVGGGGAVTAFTIPVAGTGYTPANSPYTTATGGAQPGVGTGFTINVLTVPTPVGDLYVTIFYALVTVH